MQFDLNRIHYLKDERFRLLPFGRTDRFKRFSMSDRIPLIDEIFQFLKQAFAAVKRLLQRVDRQTYIIAILCQYPKLDITTSDYPLLWIPEGVECP